MGSEILSRPRKKERERKRKGERERERGKRERNTNFLLRPTLFSHRKYISSLKPLPEREREKDQE
jgi:hypothetical protein